MAGKYSEGGQLAILNLKMTKREKACRLSLVLTPFGYLPVAVCSSKLHNSAVVL